MGGGAPASPAASIDLAYLQATTDAFLDSGASIGKINAVRTHCSDLEGGQFAA